MPKRDIAVSQTTDARDIVDDDEHTDTETSMPRLELTDEDRLNNVENDLKDLAAHVSSLTMNVESVQEDNNAYGNAVLQFADLQADMQRVGKFTENVQVRLETVEHVLISQADHIATMQLKIVLLERLLRTLTACVFIISCISAYLRVA